MAKEPYFEGYLKTPLGDLIQRELTKYSLGEEFEYPLLSRLVAAKHYYCSSHNIIPIKFRKDPPTMSQYDFKAYFNEYGWKSLSWRQCITPLTDIDIIKRGLRNIARKISWFYKADHPICEICKKFPTEEVHHDIPPFKNMAEIAINMLTEQEISILVSNYDFFNENKYEIPFEHKIVQYIIEAHKTAKLVAMCIPCHRKVKHG